MHQSWSCAQWKPLSDHTDDPGSNPGKANQVLKTIQYVSVSCLVFLILFIFPRRYLLFLVYSPTMMKVAIPLEKKQNYLCKISVSDGQDAGYVKK